MKSNNPIYLSYHHKKCVTLLITVCSWTCLVGNLEDVFSHIMALCYGTKHNLNQNDLENQYRNRPKYSDTQ